VRAACRARAGHGLRRPYPVGAAWSSTCATGSTSSPAAVAASGSQRPRHSWRMLAEELGPSGTRINGILPVRIATDRVRQLDALSGDPDEVRARKSEDIPLRRYGEPEEFGRAAAFLLSPAASYITGAMIPVDGGSLRAI
jgi:3-oxoacyl-[acyl-carrier protein] reductase